DRVDQAAVRLPRAAREAVGRKQRLDLAQLSSRDEFGADAKAAAERDVVGAALRLVLSHGKQIPDGLESGVTNADMIAPVAQDLNAGLGEPGGDLVAVVGAHLAEAASGHAGGRPLRIDEQDVADASPGKLQCDVGPYDAGTDDDDFRPQDSASAPGERRV